MYELDGHDEEGWPIWNLKNKFPVLSLKEQDILLKQSVLLYFKDNGINY